MFGRLISMHTAKSHSAPSPASPSNPHPHWGAPPWQIDFTVRSKPVPQSVDFAIVGGGFTGLAAASWLRHLAPEKSVAVFEADRIGAGASGRTGGMALAESAAGHLPGLGNVLAGVERILAELDIDCDLSLPGAFEIGRGKGLSHSPIDWSDSGTLRVVQEVPGGTLDPGKLVAGLARAADERGATIIESHPVTKVEWKHRLIIHAGGAQCSAGTILFATNALALELTSLAGRAEPKLTLAVLTEAIDEKRLEAIGLAGGNPFYTVDLPYLWGRRRRDGSVNIRRRARRRGRLARSHTDRYNQGAGRGSLRVHRAPHSSPSSGAQRNRNHAQVGRSDPVPWELASGLHAAPAK
jgi:glycine/D-amino acid oxidase-like deaminating enzyme